MKNLKSKIIDPLVPLHTIKDDTVLRKEFKSRNLDPLTPQNLPDPP